MVLSDYIIHQVSAKSYETGCRNERHDHRRGACKRGGDTLLWPPQHDRERLADLGSEHSRPASAPAARGAVASRLPRERASPLAEAWCMSPPLQHPWRAQRRTASRATPYEPPPPSEPWCDHGASSRTVGGLERHGRGTAPCGPHRAHRRAPWSGSCGVAASLLVLVQPRRWIR